MRCCECGELFTIPQIEAALKAYFRLTQSKSQVQAILDEPTKEQRVAELLTRLNMGETEARSLLGRQKIPIQEPVVEKIINLMRDIQLTRQ